MINYSQKLSNYYYFITDTIVFKIDSSQDEDKCGKHFVYYNQREDKNGLPVTVNVKVGDIIIDETHTEVKLTSQNISQYSSNNKAPVYGESLNHTKCGEKFPHLNVNYIYNKGTQEEPVMENVTMHYYMQDMIKIGDFYKNGTFERNNLHTESDDTSYKTAFEDSIKEDVEKYVKKGYSTEQIKNTMPHWCFSDNLNKEFKVNGKIMKLVSVSGITQINNQTLQTLFNNAIKEKVENYTNELLKVEGKQVNTLTITQKDL